MVAGEVIADGPSQPNVRGLAQVDMRRLLCDPDGLSELLRELDCAEAAQVVDYLAAHLHSATKIDALEVIYQLALLCADDDDRQGQSSMRCLSRSVAAFVADCMQFVADDDVEIVIVDFVSTASLAASCELLLQIGRVHRPACAGRRVDVVGDVRHVTDADAVEPAMEIWRHRAMRAMASGYVLAEGELYLLVAGLARFSVGAISADAVAACSNEPQRAWGDRRKGRR